MRKVIGALVIVLFLLSLGAIYLGNALFEKRELLKGRTQTLEAAIAKVAKVIESEAPVAPELKPDDFPAKDISPCKAEALDKPDVSTFWQKYKRELEVVDVPLLNLDTDAHRAALMNLYKRNPVDGSVMRNMQGFPETKGEGTMSSILDDLLIKKASEQLDRLNDTRQQLKDIRVELASTIKEINETKPVLRGKLKEIVALNEQIEGLKKDVKTITESVDAVKAEKKDLEDKNNQAKADIAKMQESLDGKDAEITQLKKKIKELGENPVGPGVSGEVGVPTWKPSLGAKGRVIQVNPEWNFVIVELSDEFIAESQAAGRPDPAGVELLVKRPGKTEKFISKIRITQVKRAEKLAIGDNMGSWQQAPIKEGDVLFY